VFKVLACQRSIALVKCQGTFRLQKATFSRFELACVSNAYVENVNGEALKSDNNVINSGLSRFESNLKGINRLALLTKAKNLAIIC
jgi:hypothetical protein